MSYDVMFDQLEKEIAITQSDIENNKKNVMFLFEYCSGLRELPEVKDIPSPRAFVTEDVIVRAGRTFSALIKATIALVPKLTSLQRQLDELR